MSPARFLLALSVVVSVSLPALAGAGPEGSWPQFHGPNRDNISTERGLLREWPEGGPPLLWTAEGIGHGFSSMAVAEGLIYTAGNLGGNTVITALDLDGKIVWQASNGPAWEKPVGGSRGTPTIDAGRLYHLSPHGDLVCLDAKTGEKRWGFNVLSKYQSKPNQWGLAESVLVEGDVLYCRPGGPRTCVVALDKLTGGVLWESPTAEGDLAAYSSMVLVEHDGLRMILSMTTGGMIGVRAEDGDLLWRFPHKTPYNENIMTPVFHDGQVFFSTGFGRGSVMLKVSVDGRNAAVEELWRNKDLDNHHGDVVLLDGYLYGSCWKPDSWTCLEWATGETMYRGAEGIGKGSGTCADGMLYTLGEKTHQLGLVKPTPEVHRVVSRFKLPPRGEGPSWAHPVVCGGRLYVRHGKFMYAYAVRAADDARASDEGSGGPESPRDQVAARGVPVIDFHVHLRGGMTVEKAVARQAATGIRVGVLRNIGRGWPIETDDQLRAFLDAVEGRPVYVGVQVNDRDWMERHSPELLGRLDYVLADTMIMPMPDDQNRPVKLWMPEKYTVDDPQAWMERYMRHNLRVLAEPVTILANPTYLPPPVADRYDELWTEERMRRVIRAAIDNHVALEINARSGLPHGRFIRMAKRMGAKFTFGSNNFDDKPIDMSRCFEAIDRYGLTKDDMYVPAR